MLDIFNILNTPGVDVQTFNYSNVWQTWQKPRGSKFTHIFMVGGGSSGGHGLNTSTTSGGGSGGGSGGQTSFFCPSFLLPDFLYLQTGAGGRQPHAPVSAAVGVVGGVSYVCVEPSASTTALILLRANGGAVTGTAATTTLGGLAGSAATATTIASMPLCVIGTFQAVAGQVGNSGGTSSGSPTNLAYPITGLLFTGGGGGGGTDGTTPRAGGSIIAPTNGLGTDWYTLSTGGNAASGATPARPGSSGIRGVLGHHFGGAGGGGANATGGGQASDGGNGAPGCGGGGAGGSTTTNATLARGGDGGDGFIIITSIF